MTLALRLALIAAFAILARNLVATRFVVSLASGTAFVLQPAAPVTETFSGWSF